MNENEGCQRVRARLERSLDDALPPLERALDQGHLEACAGCRRERDRWEELLAVVGDALRPDEAELASAVRGLVPVTDGAGPRRRLLHFPRGRMTAALTTAAAAILLLVALGSLGVASESVASLSTTELWPTWELRLPTATDLLDEVWIGEREAR